MTNAFTGLRKPSRAVARVPFYYGWVMTGLAALAMVGTLPGRTQGLGLVTESLIKDLQLDRVGFAQMNLWATLLGSLFCLGIGRLVDQLGSRVVLTLISLALGGVVLAMCSTSGVVVMFLLLLLSRGLGQSALSVVSLTMVGQWFKRRLSLAMGLYSVLLSIGFMAAFPLVGSAVLAHGWRDAWAGMGWFLVLGLGPLGILLARRGPGDCGLSLEGDVTPDETRAAPDFTWLEALWTPAFWVFVGAGCVVRKVAAPVRTQNRVVKSPVDRRMKFSGDCLQTWSASITTGARITQLNSRTA